MSRLIAIGICKLLLAILPGVPLSSAQSSPTPALPEKVILDTDIGDDIDDAFALALALRSPELQILGFTTTFGDTETRAKLLDRFRDAGGESVLRMWISEINEHGECLSQLSGMP